jgi:beta-lactamase regulating signal transducer with metallopeptidase domain
MSLFSLFSDAARAAVLLAVALVAVGLARRASAATRHLVLLAAMLAVIALPFLSAVSPAWRAPALSAAMARVEAPLTDDAPLPMLSGALPEGPRAAPAKAEAARPPAAPSVTWRRALVAAWALGACAVLARLGLGIARARRLARRARSIGPAFDEVIGRAALEAGVPRPAVRVTDELQGPAVMGLFAPVVLMPRAALRWSEDRWRVVLLHELAHVRRRDCLAQAAAQVACALHWFDPLAWIAARRMRAERELAADDRVLAAGTRASGYAEHLLAVAVGAQAARAVPAAALGMAQRSELESRVEALLAERARGPMARGRVMAVGAAAALLLLAVACVKPLESGGSAPVEEAAASAPTAASVARRQGVTPEAIALAAGATPARVDFTFDAALQTIAEDETDRAMRDAQPTAATVIVLDPKTGEVLALTSRSPRADGDVALQKAYIPGSTVKPFTVAAALEEGTVKEDARFFCENGKRAYGTQALLDAGSYGWLDIPQILAVSSNICSAKIYDTLGGARLGAWLRRLHFGAPSPVQAPDVSGGALPERIDDTSLQGAHVAMGEGLTATPIQIAAAFAALANEGVYNAPTLVRRVRAEDGRVTWEHTPERERVMGATTAEKVMTMLEGVVHGELGTGRAAQVEGYRVAGKTGTAMLEGSRDSDEAYYASFVGAVPARAPRFVILVGIEAAKGGGSGGKVAAPVFARVAARAMASR